MNNIFEEYTRRYAGKRVDFLGVGVSHIGIIPDFVRSGARVVVRDRAAALSPQAAAALSGLPIEYHFGADYLLGLSEADLIFRSPGITPLLPEIKSAVKAGAVLTGEIELFFDLCPYQTIGVTGSDGKTTTTTLIYEMLSAAGRTAFIGGNIGDPLLPRLKQMSDGDIAVVELSSFQLMTFKTSPKIAVVTNIHQNHLDYHTDMAEYIEAKKQVLLHGAGVAVLNADDPVTLAMSSDSPSDLRYFSERSAVGNGAYVADGGIWLSVNGEAQRIISTSELLLRGSHNAMNAATAIAALSGLVPTEIMRSVLASFTGVKHRIQFVKNVGGVSYYNDSIATTPSRTVMCLRAFPSGSILIAGGSDKGVDYYEMAHDTVERVKLLILSGATSDKIAAAVTAVPSYAGRPEIVRAASLEEAVAIAARRARPGDNVLLSPASASFDCFKNYGARGDRFVELVGELNDASVLN